MERWERLLAVGNALSETSTTFLAQLSEFHHLLASLYPEGKPLSPSVSLIPTCFTNEAQRFLPPLQSGVAEGINAINDRISSGDNRPWPEEASAGQGVASPLDDTVRAVVLWEHTLLSQWHSSIVSAEAALPPAVPPTPAPTTLSTPLAQASPAATSQQSERKGKMYVGHGVWLPTIPAPPPRRRPVEEGMAISSGNGGATAALEPQASAITVAPITVGSGPPPPVPRRKK